MTGISPQTQKQLSFSVEQYCELLQHAQKLSQMLSDCDYSRFHEHLERLQELQTAASQQDERLLPLLITDIPACNGHPLYLYRLEVISSILKLNEMLLPKIRSMMAVTSTEITQLHGGRVALTSYASPMTGSSFLRVVG